MTTSRRPTVWLLSELYHPELTSTGHYMTVLAEHLAAQGHRVCVLCSQPTYDAHGIRAPRTEERHGVRIRRCRSTAFHKDRRVGRVLNLVTLTASVFAVGVAAVRRRDVVIAVSNPPTMPLVAVLLARLRGARAVVWYQDLLPVVLESIGGRSPRAPAVRLAARSIGVVVRRATAVVVVGRPPVAQVVGYGAPPERVHVIPTWADEHDVVPLDPADRTLRAELGLTDRRVVLYAGAFSRANDVDVVLRAAAALRARTDVTFVFCGSGPRRHEVEAAAREHDNVLVAGPYPRERQTQMFGIGDVVVVPLVAGMGRSSMPSRAYNALAAGRPVVAAVDAHSELAQFVAENDAGIVVPAGDDARLAAAIEQLVDDPDHAARSATARRVAETACSSKRSLASWAALIARVEDDASDVTASDAAASDAAAAGAPVEGARDG